MSTYQQKIKPLIGNYITLRLLKKSDYPHIRNILCDLKTMEHLQHMTHTSVDWTKENIISRYEQEKEYNKNNFRINLIVTKKDTGNIVGDCGFNNIVLDHHRAELGIILRHAVWGTSVCAECHYLFLTFGYEKLNLHRIEWSTSIKNVRMRKFLEKIHCKLESIRSQYWQINGCYMDECVYVLFEYQWPNVKELLSSMIREKATKSNLKLKI